MNNPGSIKVSPGKIHPSSKAGDGLWFRGLKRIWISLLFILSFAVAGHLPGQAISSAAKKPKDSKPVIAVLGSSLAAGWVTSREAKFDMQNGWAFRLERLLSDRGFRTMNISRPGDTTHKVLQRMEKDLFPLEPDFVIISLSLENEGIRGIHDKIPEQVYQEFKANLKSIIKRCREKKIVPVLASCYPSDNYTEDKHYTFVKDMNLELAGWDVPGINLMGALDNGQGGFVDGITFDLDHPDSRGHAELFYSVVPSLFEALSQGIPLPAKNGVSGYFPLEKSRHPAPLSFQPADPLHSFTLSFEVKPASSGVLAAILNTEGDYSRLHWQAENKTLIYQSGKEKRLTLYSRLAEVDGWLHITLSHHYLKGKTQIFVNGRLAGSVKESIIPVHLVLGGHGDMDSAAFPMTADFRNWMIHRSALNEGEAIALSEGLLLQPSLELFSPLTDEYAGSPHFLKNLAQSTSCASAFPQIREGRFLSLKKRIAALDQSENIYVDPDEKEAIPIEPKDVDTLVGDFTVDKNLVLTVAREKDRLFLLFNGGELGKLELFALSPTRFFIRIVGPEAEAEFMRDEKGTISEIMLTIGPNKITGKKKHLRTQKPRLQKEDFKQSFCPIRKPKY